MSTPPKCVLVSTVASINPRTGSGQRTGIFYSALKRVAPTEVVLVGARLDRAEAERWFPGHAGLHFVHTLRPPHRRLGGLALTRERLQRFLWFSREYRPDPAIRDGVREVLKDSPGVVVYRYFSTFSWAGHDPDETSPARICVDIDDSDDQKLLLAVREAFKREGLTRVYRRLAIPALRRLMRRRLAAASLVWFATEDDVADLPGLPAAVVPNVPFSLAVADPGTPASGQRDVLFLGGANYPPNVEAVRWFLQQCWPELHRRHPQSRFRIVGFGDWSALAAEFPGIEGADFVGAVEDVTEEYNRARLVVAPIFTGGGTKIKVIEACAHARPVVTTPHSARGFGPDIEAALPRADTAPDFIRLCATYLDDSAAADALGARLRRLQSERFSREAVERLIARQISDLPSAGRDA